MLGPLQFQLPHLGRGVEGGGWCGGSLRLPGEAVQPSRHTLPPALPGSRCPPAPHLGLELRQLGLTLQEGGLELGSAALRLSLCHPELVLVLGAGQQAPGQGLRELGLEERGRDVPHQVEDRSPAELTFDLPGSIPGLWLETGTGS